MCSHRQKSCEDTVFKPGRETSEETPSSWIPGLLNYEKINVCYLSHPVLAFCFGSPTKFNTDYMFYINKIYNVKNQTKIIYSFRSQNSGYFLGKESSDLEEAPERFLDNIDIPFAIVHFALCIFCAFLEYM